MLETNVFIGLLVVCRANIEVSKIILGLFNMKWKILSCKTIKWQQHFVAYGLKYSPKEKFIDISVFNYVLEE